MPTLARKYAVILGSLAMTATILRAVKEADPPVSALWTAIGWMLVFAAIGLAAGWLADTVVVESIRSQAETQLQSIPGQTTQKAETSRMP